MLRKWKFYIGQIRLIGWFIDHYSVNDARSNRIKSSVQRHIPVLAYFAKFETPPNLYDVDDETKSVCTYLRAFRNGTINRKFKYAKKQMVFLLDKSGNMKFSYENGTITMDWAIVNALEIFDSHIRNDDVSSLCVLFFL